MFEPDNRRLVAMQWRRHPLRFPIVALAMVGIVAGLCTCSSPPPDLDLAMERGLSYVATAYNGNSFDDEYLRFVYSGERLASPVPGYQVSYRLLDAYFIALMLQQTGVENGPASELMERAGALTQALVGPWRQKGIYNLRRRAVMDGIALDTYAILGRLYRDHAMAEVILRGLDGDGWLPANLYHGSEAFRLQADESWALRLLVVTNIAPEAVERVATRLCEETRYDLEHVQDPIARANLALHAIDVLHDMSSAGGLAGSRQNDLTVFLDHARLLLRDRRVREETLTLANLIGVLARHPEVPSSELEPSLAVVLRRQAADGSWSVTGDEDRGRVFATLRCLLTLGTYKQHRVAGALAAVQ